MFVFPLEKCSSGTFGIVTNVSLDMTVLVKNQTLSSTSIFVTKECFESFIGSFIGIFCDWYVLEVVNKVEETTILRAYES